MKIGILTFHNADNYGAVLQCYALQETLRRQFPNDDVCIIDYKNQKIEKAYQRRFSIFKPLSILTKLKYEKKHRNFQKFRKKFLNIGSDDFSLYDIIYYGSDQIWSFSITNKDLTYFGINYNGKKIAYGVSDGGELCLTPEITNLLNAFSEITCREKTLTEQLLQSGIKNVTTVYDPVFLLSKEDWLKIAEFPKIENYVLAYRIINNPDFDSELKKVGKFFNKQIVEIVYVKALRKFFNTKNYAEGISPEQFVGYFAKADFVITTSFHGTAFSIIFEKSFNVLTINKRSERITDLLDKFGLNERYVSSVDFHILQKKYDVRDALAKEATSYIFK